MTENKRYEFLGTAIRDMVENERISCNKDGFQDVCDMLNEQHETIQELKSEIEELENKIEVLEGKLWNCQNVR